MNFGMKKHFLMMPDDDEAGGSSGSGEGDKNKGDKGGDGSGNQDAGNQDAGSKLDISKLPQEAQDLIKSLRAESAKHRVEGKKTSDRLAKIEEGLKKVTGDDDDKETPEEKLSKLEARNQEAELKSAMLEIALDNGIAKEDREYFEFLMSKALSSLEEDEELTEEALEEIVAKCKSQKGKGNTSVDDKQKGNGNQNKGEVSLEEFTKMGMIAKSKLFNEKPDLYNSLMAQAKSKKLL